MVTAHQWNGSLHIKEIVTRKQKVQFPARILDTCKWPHGLVVSELALQTRDAGVVTLNKFLYTNCLC